MLFVLGPVLVVEPGVAIDRTSLAVEEDGGRHRIDAEGVGELALRVVAVLEVVVEGLGEPIGGIPGLADVHRDHDQALATVLGEHRLHPRERPAARNAPGGPEVDENDLAAPGAEVENVGRRLGLGGLPGDRRSAAGKEEGEDQAKAVPSGPVWDGVCSSRLSLVAGL